MATNQLSQMIQKEFKHIPEHFKESVTNVDLDVDLNNGSIGWMRCIKRSENALCLPSRIRDAVMKRYIAHICYTFMKNFIGREFNIPYQLDSGIAFNPNVAVECYSILMGDKKMMQPNEISYMNMKQGNAPACYITEIGSVITDEDGNPSTYFLNDWHEQSGAPPLTHHKVFIDFNKPIVATKFINGGINPYDLLMTKCLDNMTSKESTEHIQTIFEYNGTIPVAYSIEDHSKIKSDLVEMWNRNPVANRETHHSINITINELLYYVIQKIDNPFIVESILASQYVLDHYGTSPIIPSLQKMYELMSDGIPDGSAIQKNCPNIEHPMVVSDINNRSLKFIEQLNDALDIHKYLKISDQLIEDVSSNCEDALILTFIGDIHDLNEIDEPSPDDISDEEISYEGISYEGIPYEIPHEIPPEIPDDTQCQICFEDGGTPISNDEHDDLCSHKYHPVCLARWALSTNCRNNNCCPTCRKPFGN